MSIKVEHLRDYVIIPTLKGMEMYSDAAVNLLLGTAAQESHMGHYLHQEKGPALGIFQMEPTTHDDILLNYVSYKPDLRIKIETITRCHSFCSHDLIYNLRYATVMARLVYLRVPEPLPNAHDVKALGTYWKMYYNTYMGRGKVDEFVINYGRFVL